MKHRYLQLQTLILFAFFCCFSPLAEATTESAAVEKAYYAWCDAIAKAKGNPETVVKYYAPDATLLPTLSPKMLMNKDGGMNDYFTKLTSKKNIKCEPQQLLTRMYGNIAVNAGFYAFSFTQDDKQQTLPARFTFVYEKQGDKWLIVHHHSSKLPENM